MLSSHTQVQAAHRFKPVLRGGPLKGHLHVHQGEVADEWRRIAPIVDLQQGEQWQLDLIMALDAFVDMRKQLQHLQTQVCEICDLVARMEQPRNLSAEEFESACSHDARYEKAYFSPCSLVSRLQLANDDGH